MATFEGTFADFEKYIGPATNKIVTKLGKELKKNQRSCQNSTLENHTLNNEYCGKYKSLDAAHFSHKESDRKSMIKKILNENFVKGDAYSVNLNQFINIYEENHRPLNANLIMLCRQHHHAYDRNNRISTEEIFEDENEFVVIEDEVVAFNEDPNLEVDSKKLKSAIEQQYPYLQNGECKIASLDHENWNFNFKKSAGSGHLLCFNQFDRSVVILKYDFKNVDITSNLKKDKKKFSINIPYSVSKFSEKKLGEIFTFVEVIVVE